MFNVALHDWQMIPLCFISVFFTGSEHVQYLSDVLNEELSGFLPRRVRHLKALTEVTEHSRADPKHITANKLPENTHVWLYRYGNLRTPPNLKQTAAVNITLNIFQSLSFDIFLYLNRRPLRVTEVIDPFLQTQPRLRQHHTLQRESVQTNTEASSKNKPAMSLFQSLQSHTSEQTAFLHLFVGKHRVSSL